MFVKCDDHTKSILHAFGFDALALVNVNFPVLFPRLLQVNVNLGLFPFGGKAKPLFQAFNDAITSAICITSHFALTVRSVYSFW